MIFGKKGESPGAPRPEKGRAAPVELAAIPREMPPPTEALPGGTRATLRERRGKTPEILAMAKRKALGRSGEPEPWLRVRARHIRRSNLKDMLAMHADKKNPQAVQANQEQALTGLRQFRPLMVKQILLLQEQLKEIAKNDKTVRGHVAGELAKALDKVQINRIANLQSADLNLELPAYQLFLWLESHNLIVGDEKSHLGELNGKTLEEQKKERAAQFAKFDKDRMILELQLRSVDRLMSELNIAALWIRAKSHNDERDRQISDFNKKNPPKEVTAMGKTRRVQPKLPPELARLNPIKGQSFPSSGLIEYLAEEFNVPELKREALIKKFGSGLNPTPHPGYVPVSRQKREEVARAKAGAEEKRTLRQMLAQTREERRLEISRAFSSVLLKGFELKTAQLADRRKKLSEVQRWLETDLPKRSQRIQERGTAILKKVNAVLSAINQYALRLPAFASTEAMQRQIGPGTPPKPKPAGVAKLGNETRAPGKGPKKPDLMTQKSANALDQLYQHVNSLWYGVPNGLESAVQELLLSIEPTVRKAQKLDNIRLDTMDAKKIIASLQAALGYFAAKESQKPPK